MKPIDFSDSGAEYSEVTVAVYDVRSDAEIARARLSADGIKSWLSVDNEGGLNPGFFSRYGVRVVLRAEDLEDAYVSLGIEHVALPPEVADAMFKHSGWAYPEEACGLIAFDHQGAPRLALCLTNTEESSERFLIAPPEQFGATRLAEEHGWRIGGVFHSHPRSDAFPSPEDISGGADPGWMHFIVGPVAGPKPLLRAFRIVEGEVTEVKVTILP